MSFSHKFSIFLLRLVLIVFGVTLLAEGLYTRDRQSTETDRVTTSTTRINKPLLAVRAASFFLQKAHQVHPKNSSGISYRRGPHPGQLSCGYIGIETHIFFSTCKELCKKYSRRRCRWKRNYFKRPTPRCKKYAFLGYMTSPSCCFYRRCFHVIRSEGRGKSWWREHTVLSLLRKIGCVGKGASSHSRKSSINYREFR